MPTEAMLSLCLFAKAFFLLASCDLGILTAIVGGTQCGETFLLHFTVEKSEARNATRSVKGTAKELCSLGPHVSLRLSLSRAGPQFLHL